MKFIARVEFDIPGPLPENWVDDGYMDEYDVRPNSAASEDIIILREQLIGHWVKVKSGELENAVMGTIISIDRGSDNG